MLLLEESSLGRPLCGSAQSSQARGNPTILTCKNIVINLVNQLPTRIYCILYDRLLYKKKINKLKL